MSALLLAFSPRYVTWTAACLAGLACLILSFSHGLFLFGFGLSRHSILRNYPIAGHLRFLLQRAWRLARADGFEPA